VSERYEWHVVAEPASKPGVAEPSASLTAVADSLDNACYWASDLAALGDWEINKVTITRVPRIPKTQDNGG
jgi:hypothetical protein